MFSRSPQLCLEKLNQRTLLVSDWFNTDLRCDVDASSDVTALDALLVINEINTEGSRLLTGDNTNGIPPYLDVSNDEYLSPLDVLLIVNALSRAPAEVFVSLSINPVDDPNGNAVILGDHFTLQGQTAPFSRVILNNDRFTVGGTESDRTVNVGADGQFSLFIPLDTGLNNLTIKVRDELGRVKSVHREMRRGDVGTDWNAAILDVVRDWATTSNDPYQGRIVTARPPEVARNLAMIHVAMFDAVNAIAGRYEAYAYSGPIITDASAIAAGATAAFEVARSLYGAADELVVWQATLAESLASVPNDAARARGIDLGITIAANLLALRATDGSKVSSTYSYASGPGAWQRTFPDYIPPLLPQWPRVTPFAIANVADYRVPPPPELASDVYAQSVDEVMRLGAFDSSERTAEQTEIAVFWADGGGSATPPGHWNRIASDVINQEVLSLVDCTRTLALVNLALADAGIVSWDSKYLYNMWRPIDAIRLADTDGNASTIQDANWLPLLRTPPFPTYISGHSTFSGAAAAVLTDLFGDNYAFVSTTDAHSAPGQRPIDESLIATRRFSSFQLAAQEAGLSRIYGGIHFSFDNTQGLSAGGKVGSFIARNLLKTIA